MIRFAVSYFILFRSALAFIVDSLCLLVPVGRREGSRKAVLFVRLDGIGDFTLWLDAAYQLRTLYSGDKYEIFLLANNLWSSFAGTMGLFDAIWSVDLYKFSNNYIYRMRCLLRIRKAGFEVVVQPTYSRIFHHGDAAVRISGSPERIGSSGDLSNMSRWQKRLSDRWYSCLVPASTQPLMELVRNAEFMRGLGAAGFKAGAPRIPILHGTPEGFTAKYYYVLFPGAGVRAKEWPVERYRELAKLLYRETGWTAIICGGNGDRHLESGLHGDHLLPIQNWIGRTTLQELASIIAGAKFLIGNDTSAIHIAAAVATPAVCIVGGWQYERFVPYVLETPTDRPLPIAVSRTLDCYGCNWDCSSMTRGVVSCIEQVSVDDVWNQVKTLILRSQ